MSNSSVNATLNAIDPGSPEGTEDTARTPVAAKVKEPAASEPMVLENPQPAAGKKPCVALMGEFSAGKSTLSNLLLGKEALPVNVTATQLPPVWMSYGTEAPYRIGLDEQEYDVDPSLSDVAVEDTNHVRLFHDSKFLKMADLIDMPGISDPNMGAEVWQRVIGNADIVIWCSHATQAWRQSEAAVWGTLPNSFHDKSILLLTRMDRILSERDRTRVVKRVERETEGLFRKVLPVSLIKALEAGETDANAWAESGADDLLELLVSLIDQVAAGETGRVSSRVRSKQIPATNVESAIGEEQKARFVMPTRVRPRPLTSRPGR